MKSATTMPGTVVIVDAYSTARHLAPLFRTQGQRCVHLQSAPTIPSVYRSSFRPSDFEALVVHEGNVSATVAAVERYSPTAVIAGIESGVELADIVSEALGLRSNGTKLSSARRDKYQMIETVRQSGLPAVDQFLAYDRESLLRWYFDRGGRVVVKPVKSAGNDGVYFCDSAAEVGKACDSLLGTHSALDLRNASVLAQEYLLGCEYYVNTVSLDGTHYVSDIWKTQHLNVNGVRDLLGGSQLMPRRGPEQDQLVEHAFGVLDALGVRHGPAHTELKLTPSGPRLIETGARVCGAELPLLTAAAIGHSQLDWTVRLHANPEQFAEHSAEEYQMTRGAVCVNMISSISGTLKEYPRFAQLAELESYHRALIRVSPGDNIAPTINDFTYPMLVHLTHEVEGVLTRDYMTARYLDGEGFYVVD